MANAQSLISLDQSLGLSAELNLLTGEILSATVESQPPVPRRRAELQPVCLDEIEGDDRVQYWMIRDVRRQVDTTVLRERNMRFDLTVLFPEMLGREYSKTLGHYHPTKPGTDLSYPEWYGVVAGSGLLLLQRESADHTVTAAWLVELVAGQYVIIPPLFGHVFINCGPEILVLCNAVARSFVSDYDEYRDHGGGAYYLLAGPSGPDIQPDRQYRQVAPINWMLPNESLPTLLFHQPFYERFISTIEQFRFLTHPEAFETLFQATVRPKPIGGR